MDRDPIIEATYNHIKLILSNIYKCNVNKIDNDSTITEALYLAKELETDLFITMNDIEDDSLSKPDGILYAKKDDKKAYHLIQNIALLSGNRLSVEDRNNMYTNNSNFTSIGFIYNRSSGINTACLCSAISIFFGDIPKDDDSVYFVKKNGQVLISNKSLQSLIEYCDEEVDSVIVDHNDKVVYKSKLNAVNPAQKSDTEIRFNKIEKTKLNKIFGKNNYK